MGAGHKEKITTASDVMSGLRLSLSRRRTIELGLAVGMAFSAPGVRAAEEPPEVFFSPEVSADALIFMRSFRVICPVASASRFTAAKRP